MVRRVGGKRDTPAPDDSSAPRSLFEHLKHEVEALRPSMAEVPARALCAADFSSGHMFRVLLALVESGAFEGAVARATGVKHVKSREGTDVLIEPDGDFSHAAGLFEALLGKGGRAADESFAALVRAAGGWAPGTSGVRDNAYLDAYLAGERRMERGADAVFSSASLSIRGRSKLYNAVCHTGAQLVDTYGWCVPDERSLSLIRSLEVPIVEIGAGVGYWAKLLRARGVRVATFDIAAPPNPPLSHCFDAGGEKVLDCAPCWKRVVHGGPEALSADFGGAALFLCYPDDFEASSASLGQRCLDSFSGDWVVHVGELFGECLSMEHAPWGRTSAEEFQISLFRDFSCVCKAPLAYRWAHAMDSISIWRRTRSVFVVDDDDGDDEEEDEEGAKEGGDPTEGQPSVPPAMGGADAGASDDDGADGEEDEQDDEDDEDDEGYEDDEDGEGYEGYEGYEDDEDDEHDEGGGLTAWFLRPMSERLLPARGMAAPCFQERLGAAQRLLEEDERARSKAGRAEERDGEGAPQAGGGGAAAPSSAAAPAARAHAKAAPAKRQRRR